MDDRELLIRFRDGELPAGETAGVRRRLEEEAGLRSLLASMETVSTVVRETAVESFEPFFATRVMARIRLSEAASAADGMYEAMRWMFTRVAVVCLVLMVSIGAYSALGGGYGGTMVESVLGLPEATLETALTLGGG